MILDSLKIKNHLLMNNSSIGGFINGGDEGCRTPVRKPSNLTFYECSIVIKFPFFGGYVQTPKLVAS